ncbi:hypothetical protein CRE_24421 [Caenorhabditis remanei]|nr:hypothetical protein CRE_24421 [Caenorhabditis remanei]
MSYNCNVSVNKIHYRANHLSSGSASSEKQKQHSTRRHNNPFV